MADKILIADDDVETLRLITLMLERQGFEVLQASNGAQAIKFAIETRPDLIILDVMMPEVDGYQVTRQLRQDPGCANTPILMFTAKSQVDDKVTGYDAGVDEYLTKPIHPAELVARVKALLSRNKLRAPTTPVERGYCIAVIAPRGGMGSSTLTLNLGVALTMRLKREVVCAELRPGHGVWAPELGFSTTAGLRNLLMLKPGEINPQTVENELVRTTYGVRLLMATNELRDVELAKNSLQIEAIVRILPLVSVVTLLDIGACMLSNLEKVLNLCDEIILITEPFPATVKRTIQYMKDIGKMSQGKNKLLTVVIVNRIRADIQLTITQMQEQIGLPIAQLIPPAPEMAYQAANYNVPLIAVQPDGLVAQQFRRLAEMVAARVVRK
jgi:DNA-binding response OmpR family regulator